MSIRPSVRPSYLSIKKKYFTHCLTQTEEKTATTTMMMELNSQVILVNENLK